MGQYQLQKAFGPFSFVRSFEVMITTIVVQSRDNVGLRRDEAWEWSQLNLHLSSVVYTTAAGNHVERFCRRLIFSVVVEANTSSQRRLILIEKESQ